jgi:hypothetical protein
MSMVSPAAPPAASERQRWYSRVLVRETWASLAIVSMWLAVLFDALFGPDFVSASGASMTRIPSAVIVALFAYLGTRVVARCGFERPRDADSGR